METGLRVASEGQVFGIRLERLVRTILTRRIYTGTGCSRGTALVYRCGKSSPRFAFDLRERLLRQYEKMRSTEMWSMRW